MTQHDVIATGTDRIAEVAATLDCDLIVNLQGDEPLIEPDAIDEAIEPFRDDAALLMSTRSARAFRPTEDVRDPNVVKVVTDRRGFALYFSRVADSLPSGPRGRSPGRAPLNISACTSSGVNSCCTIAALEPTPLERSRSARATAGPRARLLHQDGRNHSTIRSASTRRRIWSACAAC